MQKEEINFVEFKELVKPPADDSVGNILGHATDDELLMHFNAIDKDKNGTLDRDEIEQALP